jgi:hypothetical protein
MYDIFYVSKGEGNNLDWTEIKFRYPFAQRLRNISSYDEIRSRAFTKMFWIIWDDLILDDTFDLTKYSVTKWDDMYVHVFKNGKYYDGICLFPKNKKISEKEFHHRFFTDKKEININASSPKKYRCFTPDTYNEYQQIVDEMFWLVWPEIDIVNNTVFDLYFSHHNSYDRRENHVFKNMCNDVESYLSGVVLCSKYKKISTKEFEKQYLVDKKEHDIVVSKFRYPVYTVESYDEYLDIVKNEKQKMFWCIWPNIKILKYTIFDLYFDPNDGKYDHDRNENHVFLNACGNLTSYLNGLVLFSKNKPISKKEFDRRYLIDKKEHDAVVSRYSYPVYNIETYDEYLDIVKNEKQKMFWCIWPEIDVIDDSVFDFYFDPNDGKYDHDRNENHVFKNLCNSVETYLNGLVLFSKNKPISKKEFDRRYLIDKKEHDAVVSRYRYPRRVIANYNEYLDIVKNEKQKMFWCIWPEIDVIDDSVFDFYFDPNDGKYDHDRNENHVFKHSFNTTEIFVNGVVLFSKEKIIGQREFNHRFLIEKKEYDRLVSKHKMYDVVFISYNESNADDNYNKLLKNCPRAKRIHGITGIHQAHIKAAEMCNTDMIWIIDGDAVVNDNFNFNLAVSSYDIDCVHVWRSENPINNLVYGNGGVKLLPRQLTLNMDVTAPDMTTSISKKFKAVQEISNITAFNTDEFTTWRSAFRECAKLASRVIDRQHEEETQQRLDIWCTVGTDKPFGEYAISGAQLGRKYGEENKSNSEELRKINDFEWLKQHFEKTYGG